MQKLASGQPVDWDQGETVVSFESLKDRCLVVRADEDEREGRLFSSVFSNWVNTGAHGKPQMADMFVDTVLVPAGPYWMGSPLDEPEASENEKPRREIYLREYQIGHYPVTNAQYIRFILDTEYRPPNHWDEGMVPAGLADHPVVNVSCEDAEAYCRWLSRVAGKHCRLPTEEEWEKAARGSLSETRRYPWGDEWQPGLCNTLELGLYGTTPVRKFEQTNQSPFGVVDMAGNVWEWTASWYERYPGSPHGSLRYGRLYRIVRGGSWQNPRQDVRISCRGRYKPEVRRPYLGFRIVQDFDYG